MKLYVIPTGGLANRMQSLASGYLLAKETGSDLIVVWQKDNGLNADFDDIFEYDKDLFQFLKLSNFQYNFFYDLKRKKNLYLSPFFKFFDERKWLHHSGSKAEEMDDQFFLNSVLSSKKDIVIMSCYPFYSPGTDAIRKIFQPTKNVKVRINEILKGEKPEIALQIRRTDNEYSIKNSPLYLFEKKIEEILQYDPKVKLYLATDDQEIKENFVKRYEDNIITNPTPARRDTKEGIIDGVAEMYILAGCKKIYGSFSSTYSVMASLIGNNELIILKL